MTHRLLITGHLADAVAAELTGRDSCPEIRAALEPTADDVRWADALAGFSWPAHATRFRWVHSMAAGVDAWTAYSDRIGILTRTIGSMPRQMGEFVASLLLAHSHRLDTYRASQRQRRWHQLDPLGLPRQCVVLGTGPTAAGIARALRPLGIDVVGINRSGRPVPDFTAVYPWADLDAALTGCTALVLCLPATAQTDHLVGREVLSRLDGAHLINVGRGSTLDLAALRDALQLGQVVHADIDVFETEPLPTDAWLWAHPHVRVTPHVAARTTASDVADAIVDAYTDLRAGRRPQHQVLPDPASSP